MQSRWKLLAALILTVVPLSARTSEPKYLYDSDHMCEATLADGTAVDLAKSYHAESQLVQAECSGSPLVILQGLRHASRSRLGRFAATALYAFAYINVFTLWLGAIDKLFAPSRGGLWYTPGNIWSITLVTGNNPPAGTRELLGWWLVPIAGFGGWALRYIADRIAQWWIGRFRRRKVSGGVK